MVRYQIVHLYFVPRALRADLSVLLAGGIPLTRQGRDAVAYALQKASASTTKPVFMIRKAIPMGKTGASKKSQSLVAEATEMLNDPQRMKLKLSEAKKTTKLLRKASVNTVQLPQGARARTIWLYVADCGEGGGPVRV